MCHAIASFQPGQPMHRRHFSITVLGCVAIFGCGRGTPMPAPPANSQSGMDLVPMTRSRPPQPPSAEVVAAVFGYPDSTRISKIEQERKPERASTIIWSQTYESGDYSFATTSIELLSAGGYLTPERKKELASEAAEMREEDAKMRSGDAKMRQEDFAGMAASLSHEFELSGGRKGFAHLAGFGPGGTGYMAVAPSPDGKYELVLRVSWSHEGSDKFRETDNTKDYAQKLQVGTNLFLEQAVRKLDATLFGDSSKTERR